MFTREFVEKLLVIVVIPFLFFIVGIRDGIPTRERFERIVPDSGAREQIAKYIEEEREDFENMITDSAYLNYAEFNKKLLEEKKYTITDSLGRSYELTKSHIAYLKRVVFGSSFGDETKTITAIRSMKPSKLDFNPHWFLYGGAYLYVCAAFLQFAHLLGFIKLGDISFFVLNLDYITRIFLAIKLVNFFGFVISTFMVYRIARKLIRDEHWLGLLAALLFATVPVYTYFEHVCKPYILAQTYVLISLNFLIEWLNSSRRRDFLLSAIFWGLSVGSNYFFVVYLFPFIIFYLNKSWNKYRCFDISLNLKYFLFFAAISAAAFFISNPYWLFSLDEVLNEVFKQSTPRRMNHSDLMNFFYFFIRPVFSIGIVGTIAAYLSILFGLKRRSLLVITASSMMLLFGVSLSLMWNMKPLALLGVNDAGASEHYDAFGVHIWLIFSIVEAFSYLEKRRALRFWLALLIVASNIWYSSHTLWMIADSEERYTRVGEWIDVKIPNGEIIYPAVMMEENMPPESRKRLSPQVLLPYFNILNHPTIYPNYSRDDVDSFPQYVVTKSWFLDNWPSFKEKYKLVKYEEPGIRFLNRIFFRYTMDFEPLLIYSRKEKIEKI